MNQGSDDEESAISTTRAIKQQSSQHPCQENKANIKHFVELVLPLKRIITSSVNCLFDTLIHPPLNVPRIMKASLGLLQVVAAALLWNARFITASASSSAASMQYRHQWAVSVGRRVEQSLRLSSSSVNQGKYYQKTTTIAPTRISSRPPTSGGTGPHDPSFRGGAAAAAIKTMTSRQMEAFK